jgi:hypothetical protein
VERYEVHVWSDLKQSVEAKHVCSEFEVEVERYEMHVCGA